MEKQIPIGEGRNLCFQLYPSLNLVAHTCNLLGLFLGGRGSQSYALRNDLQAICSVKLNHKPLQDYFDSPIKELAINHISDIDPALERIRQIEQRYGSDNSAVVMFQQSWANFYGDYWKRHESRLTGKFNAMVASRNWQDIFKQMEQITGGRMSSDYYVVGTEATGNSATMIKPNISVGSLNKDGGLVHEGFHLLIASAEEKYVEAYNFAKSHEWPKEKLGAMYAPSWRNKIEQVVVVTLDSLVSKRPEYLDACLVGDLRNTLHADILAWYNSSRQVSLPEAILASLKKHEKEIFS